MILLMVAEVSWFCFISFRQTHLWFLYTVSLCISVNSTIFMYLWNKPLKLYRILTMNLNNNWTFNGYTYFEVTSFQCIYKYHMYLILYIFLNFQSISLVFEWRLSYICLFLHQSIKDILAIIMVEKPNLIT